MGFFDNLGGKKQQACQIPLSRQSPSTGEAAYRAGAVEYKCPTCPEMITTKLELIDASIGTNVVCPACRAVSHVPGLYKVEVERTIILCEQCSQKLRVPFTDPGKERVVTCPKCRHEFPYHAEVQLPKKRIYGSIRLPIADFSDLYYEHPMITAEVSRGESDLFNDHGLWIFCGKCLHAFPSTLTATLAIHQSMAKRGAGGMFFNANSPASAKDMDGLLKNRCAHCGYNEILILVTEIPEEVRRAIKAKR